MTSGGHNRKITAEQRDELVSVYLESGQVAAEVLAARYGVCPKYAAKTANARGYKPLYKPVPTNRKQLPLPPRNAEARP